MAIVTITPGFQAPRGTIDGIVFFPRHGITLARRHVVPRNPRSAAQQAHRRAFAARARAWSTLTAREKEYWRARGRTIGMRGYLLFMGMINNRKAAEREHVPPLAHGYPRGHVMTALRRHSRNSHRHPSRRSNRSFSSRINPNKAPKYPLSRYPGRGGQYLDYARHKGPVTLALSLPKGAQSSG